MRLFLILIVLTFLFTGFDEPSRAIKRACDFDVRRLCPSAYAVKDHDAIRSCMYANKAFVGSRCGAAWVKEHPKGE